MSGPAASAVADTPSAPTPGPVTPTPTPALVNATAPDTMPPGTQQSPQIILAGPAPVIMVMGSERPPSMRSIESRDEDDDFEWKRHRRQGRTPQGPTIEGPSVERVAKEDQKRKVKERKKRGWLYWLDIRGECSVERVAKEAKKTKVKERKTRGCLYWLDLCGECMNACCCPP